MNNHLNPFTPNNPVHRGMFVGREAELEAIDRALRQTRYGNPTHILLVGERGIGKTSLLNVANFFARGEIKWGKQYHNFLSIKLNLDTKVGLIDLAINVKSCIERELNKINATTAFLKKAWAFVSKFEVGGISYKNVEDIKNNTQIIQNLVYSLVDTVKSLRGVGNYNLGFKNKKDGIVILIDEADKANEELNLGTFLKNLTETLVTEECNNILFILCGLPEVRGVLMKSHESSLRLFQEFNLSPLSIEETKRVIENGLTESEKINHIKINIEKSASDLIYVYSEGYPHFIQQIGFSVFEVDKDNLINEDDVYKGMFMSNGALQQMGARYFYKPFYQDINVESQREILRIMAEKWKDWVTREWIKKKFSGNTINLDNGIRALRDKGIIIPQEGHKGHYRLQWASFAFWIKNHKRTERC